MAEAHLQRLARLLRLLEREDLHLRSVEKRLFGTGSDVDQEWLGESLATPEGIDRLESFTAKFSRMQDTLMDKLLPLLLEAAGERRGSAIDNLDRAQRLGWLDAPDAWIAARRLRNRLVHEYLEDPLEMLVALREARTFCRRLHDAFERMRTFIAAHWPEAVAPEE